MRCNGCGVTVDETRSRITESGRAFCGEDCYLKYKEGEGKKHANEECRVCGGQVDGTISLDGHLFCSVKCLYVHMGGAEHEEGKKDDTGKLPLGLVPVHALEEVAKVFEWGADHYGAWNWAKTPLKWMRFLNAIWRHLFAFMKGEDNDKQTGLSHLAHIACTAMILLEYVRFKRAGLNTEKDDRCVYNQSVEPVQSEEVKGFGMGWCCGGLIQGSCPKCGSTRGIDEEKTDEKN